MTEEEYRELLELRAYKEKQESSRSEHAFIQLQELLDRAAFDPLMSPKAFKIVAQCILALKERIK